MLRYWILTLAKCCNNRTVDYRVYCIRRSVFIFGVSLCSASLPGHAKTRTMYTTLTTATKGRRIRCMRQRTRTAMHTTRAMGEMRNYGM